MRARALLLLCAALAAAGALPAAGAGGATRWAPTAADRFQIILAAPPTTAQLSGSFSVMELDAVETPAAAVTTLHAGKKRAVCYVDAGTWERWRPDAKAFPKSVLGKPDAGWPGERWLDIRRRGVLLAIMTKRVAVCVHKGFDAVDFDNVDGVENPSGFPLTTKAQLAYDRAIATMAHAAGLAVALKGYADRAKDLSASFDFAVVEQCAKYNECHLFSAFTGAGKPVFDIEYTTSLDFCSGLPSGVFGIAKHLSLDAWVRRCP